MEANKKFSYKAKLTNLEAMQDALDRVRFLLGKLNENESRAEVPNHGDFYGISVYLSALEKEVENLRHEVEPMAFFEKKSA